VSKIWHFTIEGVNTWTGAEWKCGVHYQTDVPIAGSEPSAAAILDHIMDHYSSSGHNLSKWTGAFPSSSTFTRCAVRERLESTDTSPPEVAEESVALSGSIASSGSDILPGALAVWLKFTTNVALRSARGGTHTQGSALPGDLSTGGLWQTGTTFWTAQNTLAASILDKIDNVFDTTGDINPGVYSQTRRDRGQSHFWELTGVEPQQQIRWLRSRMD